MADTAIEWTDTTLNPTTGCDRVSPGCDNCYALTMAKRLKGMGQAKYQNDGDPRTSGPGFGFTMHPAVLDLPLRWRKPRRVFVNSMSDLFHAKATREFLARAFAVMAATPQHTYQCLTKRPQRMARILNDPEFHNLIVRELDALISMIETGRVWTEPTLTWPLPNVWLGTSVEDQRRAAERIPALFDTPAAVRWLSLEPLLGPVALPRFCSCGCGKALEAAHSDPMRLGEHPHQVLAGIPWTYGIDWVVVGGESGPGARPMHPDWARSLRDQCQAAGVPVFVKQMGSAWAHEHGGPKKGGDPAFWPADLRVREYPAVHDA